MGNQNTKKLAVKILNEAIQSVDPYNLIQQQVQRDGNNLIFSQGQKFNLGDFKRIFITGAGKGTAPMARSLEEILGDKLTGGSVIVKYGHRDQLAGIQQFEAGHPIPDENTIRSTQELLGNLKGLRDDDCVFVLLTGGGSALFELLPLPLTLSDLQKLNSALLNCGATIHEINCVRKHISRVKGGQLARYVHPATCITLALSDVIGDNLSVIASGPTSPDISTYDEALDIIEKYSITDDVPKTIIEHLENGRRGKISETPKPGDTIFKKVHNIVIGSNRLALRTARDAAEKAGFNTLVLTSMLQGEAKEIARVMASVIREIQETGNPVARPACVLLGGEPTVQIRGKGKGGRNQELALAVALSDIERPFVFVSCGSDGTDGPTDAAGALVDENTLKKAVELNLSADQFLRNNDSYHFFSRLDDLLITGPTGTNVMDLILIIVP